MTRYASHIALGARITKQTDQARADQVQNNAGVQQEITRSDILRLAAEAQLDPRTVKRTLERGVDQMQAAVDKERLRAAAKKLKLRIE